MPLHRGSADCAGAIRLASLTPSSTRCPTWPQLFMPIAKAQQQQQQAAEEEMH